MSKTTKNRTTGKNVDTIDTPKGVNAKNLSTAQAFWLTQTKGATKTVASWFNLGSVLTEAKEEFSSKKEYGQWAKFAFPNMDSTTKTQAILMVAHKPKLTAWLKSSDCKASHPIVLIRLFKKANNIQTLTQDGGCKYKEEVDKKAGDTPEATPNENGIEGLIDTYRKNVNRLIESIEADNLRGEHLASLNTIHNSLSNALRPKDAKIVKYA